MKLIKGTPTAVAPKGITSVTQVKGSTSNSAKYSQLLDSAFKKLGFNPDIAKHGAVASGAATFLNEPTDIEGIALSTLLGGSIGFVPKRGAFMSYGLGALGASAPGGLNPIEGAALSNIMINKVLPRMPEKVRGSISNYIKQTLSV